MDKEQTISESFLVPEELHCFRDHFEYGCYLLAFEEFEFEKTKVHKTGAKKLRIKLQSVYYDKFFVNLVDRFGSKVSAVNAVFQFLESRPDITNQPPIKI